MPLHPSLPGPASPTRFFLRQSEEPDLIFITWWMAINSRLRQGDRDQLQRELLAHFRAPDAYIWSSSWIAIANKRRYFFIEFTGREFLYMTPSPLLTGQPHLFPAAWRDTLAHLFSLDPSLRPANRICVYLEKERTAEAEVLNKLGFEKAAEGSMATDGTIAYRDTQLFILVLK